MTTNAHFREVEDALSGWLWWARARAALLWSVRGLAVGLAVALGISLVARLTPLQPLPVLIGIAVACALLAAGAGMGAGLLWPRGRLAAARYFDRVFGLAERTSAALELAHGPNGTPGWLIEQQWADAAQAARGVRASQRLPAWAGSRVDAGLPVFLLIALVVSLALPNPQQQVLAQQQAVQQAITEQAQKIEDLKKQIEENPNLTEAQKEELTRPLDDAQEKLQEPNLTEEQAQQALAEAQQELQQLQDPNAEQQAQQLQQAGERLSQNQTTQGVGEALQNGDLQQAGEELANIDPTQLSAAEKQELADQLEQAARQLQESNPETAQQLQEAAEALRNGDDEAAQEALQQAGESISQTGQRAAQSQAARQASGQVQRAQQQIGQAGQQGQGQGQNQQGSGQTQGQGQGQSQGQGQGQGQQGGSQGQGQGGGGGAGQGEGNGNAQGGQSSGTSQNNGPGDGGERGYEPIYTPYRLGGSGGPETTLPNQGGGDPGEDVIGQGPTNPQNQGEVRVPYNRVFNDYRNNAYSAVDQGEYPADLKDVVKDYFSSLEP
jgi:hypothetical protein